MKAPRHLDRIYKAACQDHLIWCRIDQSLRTLYRLQHGKEAPQHGAFIWERK